MNPRIVVITNLLNHAVKTDRGQYYWSVGFHGERCAARYTMFSVKSHAPVIAEIKMENFMNERTERILGLLGSRPMTPHELGDAKAMAVLEAAGMICYNAREGLWRIKHDSKRPRRREHHRDNGIHSEEQCPFGFR